MQEINYLTKNKYNTILYNNNKYYTILDSEIIFIFNNLYSYYFWIV